MEAQSSQLFSLDLSIRGYQNTSYGLKTKKNGNGVREAQSTLSQSHIVELKLKIQIESEKNFGTQAGVEQIFHDKSVDPLQLKYGGNSLGMLPPEQAGELLEDEGYWGVGKTSERLADFVIKGAGIDVNRLQSGREGIIRGFKEAEKIWGETLPDISYKTMESALARIDERIRDLGGSVVDKSV